MLSKIHYFNGNMKTDKQFFSWGNSGLMDIKIQQAIVTNILQEEMILSLYFQLTGL